MPESPMVPPVPQEVQEFLQREQAEQYLPGVIDVARKAYSGREIGVFLHQDWEIETLRQVFVEVRQLRMTPEEALEAEKSFWGRMLEQVPGPKAVLFCLREDWAE